MYSVPRNVLRVEVQIPLNGHSFDATLALPDDATGLVIFAHGSGSSRFSSRNRAVATHFQDAKLATLLVDLLTLDEALRDDITAEFRFDIPRLAQRVVLAIRWAMSNPRTRFLPIGLFGASTGAAAALVAAAERPADVAAVVSRGGRPDLAMPVLPYVKAPTLLIVGARDEEVLELNRQAMNRMAAPAQLEIVPGASHLFEEPGALGRVAELSSRWFSQYLAAHGANHNVQVTA
jgi:dienelactone hydrolase